MNHFRTSSLAMILVGALFCIPLAAKQDSTTDNLTIIEQEKSVTNIYRAYFPNIDLARKASITFHGQLMESHYDDGYIILELSEQDIKALESFDFTLTVATDFIARRNQRLNNIQTALLDKQANPDKFSVQAIPGYSCYETVEETLSEASSMAVSYPNLAQVIDIGDTWEKTNDIGGYDLLVLKLTNKTTGGDKPKLFINSAIHAREYTTAPLNLAFARWLLEGYGVNADATWLLDTQEVHLLLQANPDGRKKAETGISWRKNTNQAYCGANSNSRGADLNRNFTDRWNITNGSGSSGNACNITYRGPSAGSEPEIQALENYVRSIWPDRRGPDDSDAAPSDTSGIHIDIHSYSELILWPWGDKNEAAPNGTALRTLGRKFAFFNGYYPQQSIGLYATDGTSDNISYGELGVPAFTFELGTSFFQNCNTYNNTIEPDNLPALIYAAKVTRAPYITPAGPDISSLSLSNNASTDGIPVGTQVTLTATTSDTRFSSRNGTEPTQNIAGAQFYIDTPPWQGGANPIAVAASDGSYDEKTEELTGSIDTSELSLGRHTVYLRAQDTNGDWGAVSAAFLIITDGEPPELSADFTVSCNGLSCNFSGSNSTGNIDNYQWNFGDGSSDTGITTNHTYNAQGTYTVSLTVSNADDSDSTSRSIAVTETPAIDVSLSSGSFLFFTYVDVSWTGADSDQVDIYRDNSLVTTTANDGAYREYIARGQYSYRVCEAGSVTSCSADIEIEF